MAAVDAFLDKMYRSNADFVFTVTRDFVRDCQTPILVLPDDVPAHPYAVAMESALPRAERPGEPLSVEGNEGADPAGACATCAPSSRQTGRQPPRFGKPR